MLQEVLHILAQNGFVRDIGPAIASCKATWTDERIWFPKLIRETYGSKSKTRLQIIAEHMTHLKENEKYNIVPKKDGISVYWSEEKWIQRINELNALSKLAGFPKIIQEVLKITDKDGGSVLTTACAQNCPKIVRFCIKNLLDYNQPTRNGATPLYFAWKSKFGKEAFYSLPIEAIYEYPRIIKKVEHEIDYWGPVMGPFIHIQAVPFVYHFDESQQQKPKKIKSKLYKQQFGPRR
jgi:hypothetical protein